MSKKIVAVSGKLRHGKDTFAKLIIEEAKALAKEGFIHKVKQILDSDSFENVIDSSMSTIYCHKFAFADPIKRVAKIIFPTLTDDDLWGPSENRDRVLPEYINPQTGEMLKVRDILTQIGQWGRSTNNDCWIRSTFGLIDDIVQHDNDLVMISDCRFKNEKKAIKEHNGIIIRIIRPSIENTSTDISEIDLDDVPLSSFDAVVYNDKDIEYLCESAKNIVRNLIYK